ncbi:Proteasome subunit beta type-7 [Coemansia sp. Benny D115]|nr:Proteasome subunit beta type-7 [Coemansia sp. Benny D115]
MDSIKIELPHTVKPDTASAGYGPNTCISQPMVTGTSVIAFKYKDGIMMATDCLASYGSQARFRNEKRMMEVGKSTVLGMSGDTGDFQYMQSTLDDLLTREYDMDDGQDLGTRSIYKCVSNIMYGRRTKVDPLWNSYVVGGIDKGEKVLGYVDYYGTTYQSSTISTGFGAHLAIPLLRKYVEGREDVLEEAEAIKILEDCMRVLYYRDARSFNRIRRAKVTDKGVEISEPYELQTDWSIAHLIEGYGA